MADYKQPEYVDRRVRFFNNQFLLDQDLIDEQRYHIDRQRRLVKYLYTPGIVDGLEVTIDADPAKIRVGKGTAIDSLGQQIVRVDDTPALLLTDLVDASMRRALTFPATLLVVITYDQVEADAAEAGSKQSSRWHERPQIQAIAENAQGVGTIYLPLAKLTLTQAEGKTTITGQPDTSVRLYAGLQLRGPLSVAKVVAPGTEIAVDAPLRVTSGTTQALHTLSVDGPLTVAGTSSLNGNVTIGTVTTAATLTVNGATTLNGTTTLKSSFSVNQAATDANGGDLYLGEPHSSHLRLGHHADYSWAQSHGSKPLAINPLGNNVGIGMTAPAARLSVAVSVPGVAIGMDEVLRLVRPSALNIQTPHSVGFAVGAFDDPLNPGKGSTCLDLRLSGYKARDTWLDVTPDTTVMTFHANGNVGIGTTPRAKLDVNGYLMGRNPFDRNFRDQEAAGGISDSARAREILLQKPDGTFIIGGPTPNYPYHIFFYWRANNAIYRTWIPLDRNNVEIF
jgi:hypothetical protein